MEGLLQSWNLGFPVCLSCTLNGDHSVSASSTDIFSNSVLKKGFVLSRNSGIIDPPYDPDDLGRMVFLEDTGDPEVINV